jgi:predicted peptidase
MGGYGTWDLASRDAYRFAAIAPICGGGNPSRARRMAHLPIWVFHGGKDRVVPISQSESMVDAIKAAGGTNIEFTIYPDARHDSWTEAYNNPKLYDWFLQHKKQERRPR